MVTRSRVAITERLSFGLITIAERQSDDGWMAKFTIEIYSPPYLFHGSRPTIAFAPDMVRHGQRFNVETPDAESIGRIVLIRPMAVTHQTDTEQRVIELPFQAQGDQLFLAAPDGVEPYSIAPRGYYMLFILNREGVPSVAQMDSSLFTKLACLVSHRP